MNNSTSLQRGWYSLTHDRARFLDSCVKHLGFLFPDKLYLSLRYRLIKGHWINWLSPTLFTEKIQWLKVYNRKPIYTTMVDKFEAKKYVTDRIGSKYVIPLLGCWTSVDDIDWDSLPNQFVLKTTHAGGGNGVVICRDKSCFNKVAAIKTLKKSFYGSNYAVFREWPYRNIKTRIIAEKYMESKKICESSDLTDYKFYCFDGEPQYCQVIRDRHTKETIDFYNMKWEHEAFVGLNPSARNGLKPVACPQKFEEMKSICRELSKDIPFIRVDLYDIDNEVYFGELTFFPTSGFGSFTPENVDAELGALIKIPNQ